MKVSIIVPVYNAQESLRRCIDSVLGQEFQDFELLLMDDGSQDESGVIIDEYAKKDSRVCAVHKKNSGVSDTRNQALNRAKGEYIQFLDADDWISSDATKLFVRKPEETNADMVISDFYRVVGKHISVKGDIDTEDVMTRQEYGDRMMENPADYYYGVIWNKLFRREILEKYHLRMDRDISFCEDFIFAMDYILHCERIVALNAPTYYYVKTEGSLVAKNMNLKKIAAMKWSVMQYYDDFYQKLHTEEEYKSRKLEILSFLIGFSKDDASIPGIPGTKRLGEELPAVYLFDRLPDNIFVNHYYKSKLISRYLTAIGLRYNLKMEDVAVLMVLHFVKTGATIKEIANYLDRSQAMILATVQKLIWKKMVQIQKVEITNSVYTLDAEAMKIGRDIEQAIADFHAVCYQGMSKEDRIKYQQLEECAEKNIQRILSDPNRGMTSEQTE